MDIFQSLIKNLDTEGRYLFLNAVANQLRYPNNHTHYFSFVLLYLFAEASQVSSIVSSFVEFIFFSQHANSMIVFYVLVVLQEACEASPDFCLIDNFICMKMNTMILCRLQYNKELRDYLLSRSQHHLASVSSTSIEVKVNETQYCFLTLPLFSPSCHYISIGKI